MSWGLITWYIVIATVIILVLYDVLAIYKDGAKASISRVMLEKAQQYPIIAFTFGVLIGHLYWQNC